MILLTVGEAIVELVQRGSTLVANHLRILTEIGQYETVLVQNRTARQADVADRVVRRLEGVVIARNWSLLEYNVPGVKLADAEKITPGFNSPRVNGLEDQDYETLIDNSRLSLRRLELGGRRIPMATLTYKRQTVF